MLVTKNRTKKNKPARKINKIDVTRDTLTSRGGLSFFAKYLENTQILSYLAVMFGSIRKSSKGKDLETIFKQLLCYLMDGTSRSLTHFDHLKKIPVMQPAWNSIPMKCFPLTVSNGFSKHFRCRWCGVFVRC